MSAYRHILLTTDFSHMARVAADRACMLARQHEASTTLFHCLNVASLDALAKLMVGGVDELRGGIEAHAQSCLNDAADELKARYGVRPSVLLGNGSVNRELAKAVEQTQADLVVMGAGGKSLIERLVHGSAHTAVIRHSKAPVLLVKDQARVAYQKVMVGVDFSRQSQACIEQAQRIAADDAKLVLLHVLDFGLDVSLERSGVDGVALQNYCAEQEQLALERLRAMAAQCGLDEAQVECVVDHGRPGALAKQKAHALGCDLMVMGKHGTGVTEELLFGSVTRSVLAGAPCDVMVLAEV